MACTVSVIIPVFNAAHTISDAIRSVLTGTFPDFEIIICDDASADETREIVGAVDDPRVRLIRNTENRGPGASREKAIAASSGDWLAFLDADDVWQPERLMRLLDSAEKDRDVIVFDDIMLCHDTDHRMKPWRPLHGRQAFGAHGGKALDVPPPRWAASMQFLIKPMIPADALRTTGIHHNNRWFQEDTEFILRLVAAGLRLRYVPHPYYFYRITPGSLSSARNPGRLTREMLEEVLPLFENDVAMSHVLQQKIAYRYFTEAVKSVDVPSIARYAMRNPSVVLELVKRMLGTAAYQTNRRLNCGASR